MIVYYFKKDIRNVTEVYYNVILSALERKGINIKQLGDATKKECKSIRRDDYILITSLNTFAKLWFWGYRNFIYWYQGVSPEENRMMRNSTFWYLLWSWFEKLSLKKVQYRIGISKYLFEHYERKYKLKIPLSSVFIMPCFNSDFNNESFFTPGKYDNNVFCYAGGMQAWQGFEDIVKLFKQIEDKHPDAFLKVLSKDMEEAQTIIDNYGLKNYSINCVPQDQVDSELAECKFGFIIREDNIINNVATPTKLGTYIGNGIIPIYSPSIRSFADLSKKYKYLCCSKNEDLLSCIDPYLRKKIDPSDMYDEYQKLFFNYYNKDEYIDKLTQFLDLDS